MFPPLISMAVSFSLGAHSIGAQDRGGIPSRVAPRSEMTERASLERGRDPVPTPTKPSFFSERNILAQNQALPKCLSKND